MSLRKNISLSILNMGIQRVLDLVSILVVTALVVRSLSRQEYGMLSVVLSYGLIFNMLNVSVSSVLVRDYKKIKDHISDYMYAFLLFSLFKGAVVIVLSFGVGAFLYYRYGDPSMIAVLALSAICIVLQYLSEPFTTLLSVDFRQLVLTKINVVCAFANIVLSVGAIVIPTAMYVSAKNVAVALIGIGMTVWYVWRIFRFKKSAAGSAPLRLLKESIVGFSLWSHLIGVMTDVIYRADLLLLGWFNAPLQVVGNYNVSLQMANFTKLLPQILQYNATLGLSNTYESRRQEEITFLFIKYSFLLSIIIMLGYVLLGRFAISIIAGTGIEEIYGLGFYMIAGLCLYNTFRPLVSYGIVVHSIRSCFFCAILPSSLGTLLCYVVMAYRWGAEGLAIGNLLGGIIMTICTLVYIHLKTDFRWRVALLTDAEIKLLGNVYARFKNKL